jgi:hypothetical protein
MEKERGDRMNMNYEWLERNDVFVMYVFYGADKEIYFSCIFKEPDYNFRENCEFSPQRHAMK